MVKISSFRSLRPAKKLVAQVTTKAYGYYSKKEIKLEKKENKYSFLNIINQMHEKNLTKRFILIKNKITEFKQKEILKKEGKEALYIYKQSNENIEFSGLICAVDLEDYKRKRIKIHEKTIKKRELLFSKYLATTKIHAEPVLLTYNSHKNYIEDKHMKNNDKLYDFKTKDGTHHQVWKIEKKVEINNLIKEFKSVKNLYIADGHHRMASSKIAFENQKCLAFIVPKIQLKTYPFHRILKTNQNSEKIIEKITMFYSTEFIKKPNIGAPLIQFYLNKKWFHIPEKLTNKKNQLLVNSLVKNILQPIFKIKDERTNKNIRFIPGNTSLESILNKLESKDVFFLMNTIDINTIIDLANNDRNTPPKSTFISPKLPSGLIMMELV